MRTRYHMALAGLGMVAFVAVSLAAEHFLVPGATFADVSLSTGVKTFRPSYGNPAWGDFDSDGKLDVFIGNHAFPPALLHNDSDGTFSDVRPVSGIARRGDRHGAGWGDYDNDGDLDLFIALGADRGGSVGTKRDQLYRNEGNGLFTDITSSAGVANAFGRSRSVNWVDIDNDGDLDLFVKNHASANVLYRNNGNGIFSDVAAAAGLSDSPGEVSSWIDFDGDGDMDLFVAGGVANDQLYRNDGGGIFPEVTAHARLKVLNKGQGVAWGDYDNDGFSDVYVARGFNDVRDSVSWDGGGITFSDQESTKEDGLDFTTSGSSVTFDLYIQECRQASGVFLGREQTRPTAIPFTVSALEASGAPSYLAGQDLGMFIWMDSGGWHIRWSSNGRATTYFYGRITSNGVFSSVEPVNFRRRSPSVKSTLYKNNGDGTFIDVTDSAGVGSQANNRAAVWGDYDNDGDLDLYVVNSGSFEANGPNALYRNNGDGTFTDVAGQAGVRANVRGRGDGAAWADFNNDGFLDLNLTNGWGRPIFPVKNAGDCLSFGPHLLYRNNGNGNHWLKVNLVGTASNRDAVGAKMMISAGGRTQWREANGAGGGQLYSHGKGPLHFGLGPSNVVDSLTVRWPSGSTSVRRNIVSNQTIRVVEARP